MSGWHMQETKIIYHYCGGRIEVSQNIKRAAGKPVYQQRGWDGVSAAVGAICPGCQHQVERPDLIDLTQPVGRAEALKAFQRARKRARKAAAAAEAAKEPPTSLQGVPTAKEQDERRKLQPC